MSKKILIVDDAASIRKMVTFTLTSYGYAVVEAVDGAEALSKAKAEKFDAILTDQNMPKMDGLTFVVECRKTASNRDTPILILTTESSDALKSKGKAAGATGWLVKPFDPQKLLDVVAKVIK